MCYDHSTAPPFSLGSPVFVTASLQLSPGLGPHLSPVRLRSTQWGSEAWWARAGDPRALPPLASLGMETVWLLWVCTGLGLAAAGLILSPEDTHTPNHWEHGLAGRRAELAFCVRKMLSAAAWVLVRLKKEKDLLAGNFPQQCAGALLKAVSGGLFYPRTGQRGEKRPGRKDREKS